MASGTCGETIEIPDFSVYNYLGTPHEIATWQVVVKCVIIGIIILVGVIGNALVIIIVSLSKKMRTTINYYIVNMAIADLFVACFPSWIHVTTDVTDGWILGEFICKFNAFVQTTAMSAISFTMIAIAGDRFFAIVFPLRARVTQRSAKIVVLVVWTCAISIGIPPLLFYKYTERHWKNYVETFCSEVWPVWNNKIFGRFYKWGRLVMDCDQGATSERIYWTVVIALLNWIPMLAMTVIYTIIIHRLHFSRLNQSGNNNQSLVQQKSTKKVIHLLFSLLIAFMICTIPFQVSTIYETYKDKTTKLPDWYHHVYFSAIVLMYAHSSVNPILYGAMNQSFRKGFRVLWNRMWGRPLLSWESRLTVLDSSIRPQLNTVNNGKIEGNRSLNHLVGPAAYVNEGVVGD